MAIDTALKSLVEVYASWDEAKQCYITMPDKVKLVHLDVNFIKLINQNLLVNGPEKTKIDANYRKLTLNFHPDRKDSFLPAVKWLEQHLMEREGDGVCFKVLSASHQKLIAPQEFKNIKFNDISNRADLHKWLETLQNRSKTVVERHFYGSLLGLLHESTGYFDTVGQIKPRGVRALVTFLPMVFISLGTVAFAEELFSVYALYFVLLKSGQYLGQSNTPELKIIGDALQGFSIASAKATTTLLARITEMTFWSSRQCYDISLQIGSAILTPLLTASASSSSQPASNQENPLCRDLLLLSSNYNSGITFQTPQLKMIAVPIESYIGVLKQQFFRGWRVGGDKLLQLRAFLHQLRVIDDFDTDSLEVKLNKAQEALDAVKAQTDVYCGQTGEAVDRAQHVINMLKESLLISSAVLTS